MKYDWTPLVVIRNPIEGIEDYRIKLLDEEKKMRLDKVKSEFMFTYPTGNDGQYRVISINDNNESVYTVSVLRNENCHCNDYLYRHSGGRTWCKHILKVWLDINSGGLPAADDDMYRWLPREVDKKNVKEGTLMDLTSLKRVQMSEENDYIIVNIENLKSEMIETSGHPDERDDDIHSTLLQSLHLD